jgi:hypothetical protein
MTPWKRDNSDIVVVQTDKAMPTVLTVGPYRFFFYSGDGSEPAHIHVERENKSAKYWLEPVRYQSSHGFPRHEIPRIERLVVEHREPLLRSWNDYFNA